jgi:CheY-like chemotaxis protein
MDNLKDKENRDTILIVEDDKISQALLREVLKGKDYILQFAKNGQETIDYLNNNSLPRIILMDIRLPDINGIDLSKQILDRFPNIIIIAQTAFANMNIEKQCFSAGMKGFVTKPLNTVELQKIIQSFLD